MYSKLSPNSTPIHSQQSETTSGISDSQSSQIRILSKHRHQHQLPPEQETPQNNNGSLDDNRSFLKNGAVSQFISGREISTSGTEEFPPIERIPIIFPSLSSNVTTILKRETNSPIQDNRFNVQRQLIDEKTSRNTKSTYSHNFSLRMFKKIFIEHYFLNLGNDAVEQLIIPMPSSLKLVDRNHTWISSPLPVSIFAISKLFYFFDIAFS